MRLRPERFESEHHVLLDHFRMAERNHPAENRLFPYRQAYAMAVLQSETGLFIGESKFLGFRPKLDHLRSADARFNHVNRSVKNVAAFLVGIDQGAGGAADRKGPVIAGAVAHVAVDQIKICWISRPHDAIGENVRMRIAALARYGVHTLDLLRTQIE